MTVATTNGTTTSATTTTSGQIEKAKEAENSGIVVEEDEDDEIKPEDLAPDGGWGWVVALAMIVVFFTAWGPAASFGLIFGDFLEEQGQSGTATTVFNSVFMTTFSASSLMTNTLISKYCIRSVGVVGAILFSVPNVALALVTNVYEMAIIYTLQGFGLGLLTTICNTNFNAYFVKKRAQVMSASQVIIGLSGIIYPICIEKMMEIYGFRGTAALTGVLSLNCIVGMALMHPVEWHLKKPEEVRAARARERESKKCYNIATGNRRSTIDVVHFSSKARWSSMRSLKDENGKESPLLTGLLKSPASRVASISGIEGGVRNRARSGSAWEPLSRPLSALSASSWTNLVTGVGALGDYSQIHKSRELRAERGSHCQALVKSGKQEKVENEKEPEQGRGIMSELLEMSLLKDRGFLNLCLGISFVFSSDYTFCVFLPLMMTNNGYTKSDAALAITVTAAAELASRVFLAIFTLFIQIKAKYLFFGAMIFMTFAKLAFLWYENTLTGALVSVAIIGMVRSWLIVPQPLVIIEDISVEKFASAYGIFAVISGIISIVFTPLVGILKDWTDSFVICQVALWCMGALFITPWTIQFIVEQLAKRRKIRAPISGFSSTD